MSTKDPNMKVIFGADTKDFDKGVKDVKQGIKDLDKSSSSAMSSIAGMFGVNTGKIEQMTSAVRGLGAKLEETGNAGAKAFGSILSSIGPLQAGIAGLGLGAAIAGFKALKEEADNFKSTIDGMNLSMATAAYISTYKQVLHDVNSETGKSVAEAMSNWEKGFARFKANVSATLATWVGDKETVGLYNSWKKVSAASREATAAAEKAEKLGSQMADLKKKELEVQNDIKKTELEMAQYRREANDKSKTAVERAEAEKKYRDKINESYDKQVQLAKDMYMVQNEIDGLANNTYDDTKNTLELNSKIYELETAREQELQKVDKLNNSIAKSSAAAAAAAQKQREELQKIAETQTRWAAMQSSLSGISGVASPTLPGVTGPSMTILPKVDAEYWKDTITAQLGDFTIGIGFEADTQKIQDISNEVNSLLQSSVMKTSEIIGNLVGTLAGGGDAWGDFKNAALSAFGDMAIAVGKIAIASGLASEGIQAALKMGNPYIAIAAGAALVALGSAVKSSLSAVASGDYSAAGGGYSGGNYSSGSNAYETRDVKVEVTGTLAANGDQLLAVINNTNNHNYYSR